jgi:hypothetical protein
LFGRGERRIWRIEIRQEKEEEERRCGGGGRGIRERTNRREQNVVSWIDADCGD